jgi:hypothetical protein
MAMPPPHGLGTVVKNEDGVMTIKYSTGGGYKGVRWPDLYFKVGKHFRQDFY